MQTLTYDKIDHPDVLRVIFHPRRDAMQPPSDPTTIHSIPVVIMLLYRHVAI
nr:hypothetical protein [Desulfobulbaceae bacterium]